MSTNNNYTPRHASSAAVEPDSEPLVAGDGAEAAFATLVSDALAERQAAREAAARDAADAVASFDVIDEAPLPANAAGEGTRTTLLEGRTPRAAQPAAASDDSALLHEARTTLLDERAARPAPARGGERAALGSTAPQQQTPARGNTYVAAPTVRRDPVAPARPAVPSEPYSTDDVPRDRRQGRGGNRRGSSAGSRASRAGRATASAVIGFLALAPRVAAIGVCALVVLCALPMTSVRLMVVNACNVVDRFVPDVLAGVLVYETPFGGAFRGDFALLALGLFIIDWLLVKVAYAIWGEEDE